MFDRGRLALIALAGCALAGVVFVQMPFGTFQHAVKDFQSFGRLELLAYAAVSAFLATLAVASVLAAVHKLFRRAFPFASAFVFSLAVMLYVQGNLIQLDYGLLDGHPIDWTSLRFAGWINSAVWLLGLVAGTCLFGRVVRRNLETAILTVFVFVCYSLVLSSCSFVFSPVLNQRVARFDDANLMELSSDRNLVVFILDSYDRGLFDLVLEQHSELRQHLAGFTYYHNTMGRFSATALSVPQLVSGHRPDPETENDLAYRNSCYRDAPFLEFAPRHGFEVDLYVDPSIGPQVGDVRRLGCFGNAVVSDLAMWSSGSFGMFRSLMRVSWFRYLPHAFKPAQWEYLMRKGFSCANADGEECDVRTERLLNENLASDSGFSTVSRRKVKIYHLQSVHYPHFTSEQGLRSLELVRRYRAAVEKAGLADCTAFVVLADHGFLNRSHPMLLCSNGGDRFIEDNRPVSYRRMADIWCSALTNRAVSVPAAQPAEMCVSSKDGTLLRNGFFDVATTRFRQRSLELIRLSPSMEATGDGEEERIVWDGKHGFLTIPIAHALRGHPLKVSFGFETEEQTKTWARAAVVKLTNVNDVTNGEQAGRDWTFPVALESIDRSGVLVRVVLQAWTAEGSAPPPIVSVSLWSGIPNG